MRDAAGRSLPTMLEFAHAVLRMGERSGGPASMVSETLWRAGLAGCNGCIKTRHSQPRRAEKVSLPRSVIIIIIMTRSG